MNRASSATGWVRNPDGTLGWTWNPITGCLNGCEYCYARKLANGRLKPLYLANTHVGLKPMTGKWAQAINDPFYPRFWDDRLHDLPTLKLRSGRFSSDARDALREKQRKGIFVCDMADLFGIGVPEEWTRAVLSQCNKFWHHRFYLLTKQPQNLIKFSPFPENCWVGVTACNADMLFDALNHLDDIQCSKRFVSIEPMLASCYLEDLPAHLGSTLDWVIIGAQTKPYKPPKWEWVSEIMEACVKAGIPYFLKDNLELIVPKVIGGDGSLIQELPK